MGHPLRILLTARWPLLPSRLSPVSAVIVVPETEGFEYHVSHESKVWIGGGLGRPKLEERSANYLVPLWVGGGRADRIYHILGASTGADGVTEIRLGNSFVLAEPWSDMGQHRRFEYKDLSDFGMAEIRPGLLFPCP